MNSSGSANNQSTKAGGDLNNLCWSGGGGGANTLPPVVATGHRLSGGIWQLRTYYTPSPGNGSPPITTERAASEKTKEVDSTAECGFEQVNRATEARRAFNIAHPPGATVRGFIFIARTLDGKAEKWVVVDPYLTGGFALALLTTECPGGGGQ